MKNERNKPKEEENKRTWAFEEGVWRREKPLEELGRRKDRLVGSLNWVAEKNDDIGFVYLFYFSFWLFQSGNSVNITD